MKKQWLGVLLGVLFAVLSFHAIPVLASEEVEIPDVQLKEAIANELDKTAGEAITEDDMKQLKELKIYSYSSATDIQSLEGIQYASNLEKLIVSNSATSELSDLSVISNLTSLKVLTISSASVSDISPLANLVNLENLQLNENKIEDISVLANCQKLRYLNLSDNLIDNIDVLAQLTNLESLQINGVTNTVGTSEQTGNKISDLTPLANLTKLESLEVCGYGSQLTDISPLANLVNLDTLNLFDNAIVDASVIENMTKLTSMSLEHNDIQNLPDMSKLTSLSWLKLNDNPNLDNEDVEKVGQAVNLQSLFLGQDNGWSGSPKIDNIEPLANLTKLSNLSICETSISDISPLVDLPLRHADLEYNKIEDVTPFAGKQINSLSLRGNQITDISSLDLSATSSFKAQDQSITLADGYQNVPSAITIAENSGAVPTLTWETSGNYTDGKLAWDQTGINQVAFTSEDSKFTGRINQNVYAGDPPAITSTINVKYVDEAGQEIAPMDTYTGDVGTNQVIEAKDISGYSLKEGQLSPQNLIYTSENQTVEFVYVEDTPLPPVDDSTIFVKYVDEAGKELADMATYTGLVGSEETINAPSISGYTLKEGQNNPQTVRYTEENQTIEFVYIANKIIPADDDSNNSDQPIIDEKQPDQTTNMTIQENKSESTTEKLPKTGDTNSMMVWLAGIFLTGLGIYGTRKFAK
ncbi:leucine-rich repeat domain-containing protein [Listeria ilorinensis]|uniref:leucine-rich repeat domain-containing protein n=1 Tax=Listeria ilorinensis TaxID=2867439 RepID=UPI001EF63918|nr:leucine-rich repeat domain-containing protein [Listeria ilorinensis]